jgi:hypothetical protein
MGIIEGISAAKAGIELTKLARKLLKRDKINRDELLGRLSEIHEQLVNARESLSDALEDNRSLKGEVEQLKAERDLRASVIPAEGAYWTRKADSKLDGPFCTVCWDDSAKLVRIQYRGDRQHNVKGLLKTYQCPLHEGTLIKLRAASFSEGEMIS